MLVAGVFLVWLGIGWLDHFGPYGGQGFRDQHIFPGSVIAMGFLFMLIPFLPTVKMDGAPDSRKANKRGQARKTGSHEASVQSNLLALDRGLGPVSDGVWLVYLL